MDVPCHLLRKNHSQTMPSKVLYLDTETKPAETESGTVHRMVMAWTCMTEYDKAGQQRNERWMEWRTSEPFCRYIASNAYRGSVLWVFAHNAFFDLQASGFFEWFTHQGWELQFVYESGLTYILSIRKDERSIKVLSSTNHFQCSLKKLGEMVGLPKLEVSFESSGRSELSRYCRRDVEIVKVAMESYWTFLRRHDLGTFSMTIPSQAMRAFRHRFMTEKIYIHQHPEAQQLERDAYYGGRTECFRLGKQTGGPFVTVDVNSMYPFIMSSQSVPVRLVDYLDQPDLDWLKDALRGFSVVSRAVLETDQPIYAVRHNKRVCFPVGRFSTVLCTAGLKEALQRGHLVSLGETAVYDRAVLFHRFVEELYELRMKYKAEDQGVWVYLCKLLMNGLYGKWAERRPVLEIETEADLVGYRREEVLDLVTGRMMIEYQLMNKRITQMGDEPGNKSLVAISAHITEAARLELWRLIETAGREKVFYCDTDSLKLRKRDLTPLKPYLHDTALGRLKVEKVSRELEIWGLKAYAEDGEWKVKGIPKRAERGPDQTYTYEHFLKQATHMRKRQITGMLSETMVKQLKLEYLKGVVTPSGRVDPFRFGPDGQLSALPPGPFASVPVSPLQ